jgi:hypothetical protein
MKFPDETYDYMRCPICNSHMTERATSVCKQYSCNKGRYTVNSVNYSHYDFIRYQNGEVLFHYFIPPIMVWSTEGETEIYLNEKYQGTVNSYYSRLIAKNTNPLYLVEDNLEDIKKKIKIYSLFI